MALLILLLNKLLNLVLEYLLYIFHIHLLLIKDLYNTSIILVHCTPYLHKSYLFVVKSNSNALKEFIALS